MSQQPHNSLPACCSSASAAPSPHLQPCLPRAHCATHPPCRLPSACRRPACPRVVQLTAVCRPRGSLAQQVADCEKAQQVGCPLASRYDHARVCLFCPVRAVADRKAHDRRLWWPLGAAAEWLCRRSCGAACAPHIAAAAPPSHLCCACCLCCRRLSEAWDMH